MTDSRGSLLTENPPYLSFDRVAECYESSRYIPPEILDRAAGLIAADPRISTGARLLDVGVGTGRFARYLTGRGIQVVGLDVSLEMLARAAGLSQPLLLRADARNLPLRSDSLDGALVVHLLHIISDWQRVVTELRRTLKANAPLFLGSEGGKHFVSRSLYFQVAAEWKLTRPNLGAGSLEVILEHLRESGAKIERVDGGELTWTARASVREMMETLRKNPFTHLWQTPPEEHSLLMAEVERRAAEVFDSRDHVEEAPAWLSLWTASWP